jgi:signal transduction histidine kinase
MSDDTGRASLEFFSAVTATISHDIKNRLAVINEQAGLLEDYLYLCENGREMDVERLKRVAKTVKQNVSRADGIVKTMNLFAHSADNPAKQIDLYETLNLVALLSKRAADLREVSLVVDTQSESAQITTSLFHLLNLIWICLDTTIKKTAPGGSIALSLGKREEKLAILIKVTGPVGDEPPGSLPAAADAIADELGMSADTSAGDGTIVINCR